MKLNIDLEYVLKRLIVIVLAFIIISNLKSCNVSAQNLSVTNYIGYWNYDGTQESLSADNPRTINGVVSGARFVSRNTSLLNNNFSFESDYKVSGDYLFDLSSVDVILRSSSSSSNISNYCAIKFSPCNDGLGFTSCYNFNVVCNGKSNLSDARDIEFIVRTTPVNNLGTSSQLSVNPKSLIVDPSDAQQIMSNADENTNIISGDIGNLNNSINQGNSTLNQIASNQKPCRDQNIAKILDYNKSLDSNGNLINHNGYGVTGFIRVYDDTDMKIYQSTSDLVYLCKYSSSNSLIGCESEKVAHTITLKGLSSVVYFVRLSIDLSNEKPKLQVCEIDRATGVIQYLDGTFSDAGDFGGINSYFGQNIGSNFGLQSVITGPITMIQRATETCSPKSFSLFNQSIVIPCGTDLFWEKDFTNNGTRSKTPIGNTNTSSLNSIRDNFRLFWNTLFGGAILFLLALKLWKVTQSAMDPLSDSFETISSAIDVGDHNMKDLADTDIDEFLARKEL